MSAKDGGPAFPVADFLHPSGQVEHGYTGMTLHQWYAGKALQALISNHQYGNELKRLFDKDGRIADTGDSHENPQEYTARLACSFADAMISERNKTK